MTFTYFFELVERIFSQIFQLLRHQKTKVRGTLRGRQKLNQLHPVQSRDTYKKLHIHRMTKTKAFCATCQQDMEGSSRYQNHVCCREN